MACDTVKNEFAPDVVEGRLRCAGTKGPPPEKSEKFTPPGGRENLPKMVIDKHYRLIYTTLDVTDACNLNGCSY